jgi:hypothetical protein
MAWQASREHHLSKDRAYPQVGDVDFSKVAKGVAANEVEINSALDARREETTRDQRIRHDETDEKLTEYIQTNFSGTPSSLRELEPLIEEIRRRFKHLPRKVNANGERQRIAGHTTFKSWCAGILNRTVNEMSASFDANRAEVKKESEILLEEILAVLPTRHEETDEKLSSLVRYRFSGSLLSLEQIIPLIEEIKRRFKHLPRKVGVDGKYKTICGHRTFKSWCKGVMNRHDRTVRYMIAGAKNPAEKKEEQKAEVFAVSERVKKYLTKRVDKFEGAERTELIEEILKAVEEMA